jgi:8-oxo-dGTP pyrophosphatase MutT (NUDIX family)
MMKEKKDIAENPDDFIQLIVKRLEDNKADFLERHRGIVEEEKKGVRHFTSGVVLLIHFSEEDGIPRFILTKRSEKVVQPGDLSCPGGHISMIDRLHGLLITKGLSPLIGGDRIKEIGRSEGKEELRVRANYLACALRETAEETGLSMRRIDYLGSLPPYGLMSFRRVIFPSVGVISGALNERLNWEVERIVPVGIEEMFNPENYCWIDFDVPDDLRKASSWTEWKFPSFMIDDAGGREILWGATFNIILSFLWIVLGFTLPEIPADKIVRKDIPENYFTGGFKKILKAGFERDGEV